MKLRRGKRRGARSPVRAVYVGTLASSRADDVLVSVSVGAGGEAGALWASEVDAPLFHAREGGGSFAVDRLDRAVPVRATVHAPDLVQEIAIGGLELTFPMVQPMPGGAFLVVGPRVRRGRDRTPPNAILYDAGGRPRRR